MENIAINICYLAVIPEYLVTRIALFDYFAIVAGKLFLTPNKRNRSDKNDDDLFHTVELNSKPI